MQKKKENCIFVENLTNSFVKKNCRAMGTNQSTPQLPTSNEYKQCIQKIESVQSVANNEALVSCTELTSNEFDQISRMPSIRTLESNSKYNPTYAALSLSAEQLEYLRPRGEHIIRNASDAYNECIRKVKLARNSGDGELVACQNLSLDEFLGVSKLAKVYGLHHSTRTSATFVASSGIDKPNLFKDL